MSSSVSTRGQITVDRAAREVLGVRPGMVAHQRVVDGRLEVVFLPARHTRSLYGALGGARTRERSGQLTVTPDNAMERDVEEAVAADWEQRT